MTVPGPFTMSQQAQNDFYPSLAEAAMDLRRRGQRGDQGSVRRRRRHRADRRALSAGAARIAERYGLEALNRALEGVNGVTAVHICFGYAAIIHERPSAYSFLPQLKGCRCQQISIETAQVKSRLRGAGIAGPEDHPRRARSLDAEIETPETVAARIRRALKYRKPRTSSSPRTAASNICRATSAFGKMKAMVEGARIVRAELAKA
jgi:5-methyltetrahydropteroyltriglutamate--homocysteine methyltransferase